MAPAGVLDRLEAFEVKDGKAVVLGTDDRTGGFEALVSVTNIIDHGGDLIEPGAYAQTIKARPQPKVLVGHDWGRVAGKVDRLEEWLPGDRRLPADLLAANAGALWVKGRYNLRTTEGRDAYERLVFDPENQNFSIGYDCSADKSGQRAFRDKTGVRRIKSLTLFECSDVVVGMADGTRLLCVKALAAPELFDPARRYSIAELVGIATKAASDNQGFNAGTVGSVKTDPADAASEGEDVVPLPLDGQTSDARLSVIEWKALAGVLEGKDWAEFDAERQGQGTGRSPAPQKPDAPNSTPTGKPFVDSGDDGKPSTGETDEHGAPAAGSGGGQPVQAGSTGAGNPAATGDDSDTEGDAPKPPSGGGEGGKSPVEGLVEKAQSMLETIKEGYEEGRERGHQIAEQVGEPGAALNPFAKSRKVLIDEIHVKDLGTYDGMDDDGDSDDPGVNRATGTRGDLSRRMDAPEDANLNRGVPDEGGRHDWAAVKGGVRYAPLVRAWGTKGSDDQERDDHGRFAGSGGGGGSGLHALTHDRAVGLAARLNGVSKRDITTHPSYAEGRSRQEARMSEPDNDREADRQHAYGEAASAHNVGTAAMHAGALAAIEAHDRFAGDGADPEHERLDAAWHTAFGALQAAGLEADADHPIAERYRAVSDAVNHANRLRDYGIATGRIKSGGYT